MMSIVAAEYPLPDVDQPWDAIVRLYGHPSVENPRGERAVFAKNRSLEVVSWLGMNRDRSRRSAVRTAIWDIEISDSTFSTILSDIRRGLNRLSDDGHPADWMPPTFTDAIELGNRLTTDFDLLHGALTLFKRDEENVGDLTRHLSRVRDTPFAGTGYAWADLDGTTTRMVMVAIDASLSLAHWAETNNNTDACLVAVKAGLRVMPGCEELLEIQNSFLSSRLLSR